jgi:site-specific recombinase XerD
MKTTARTASLDAKKYLQPTEVTSLQAHLDDEITLSLAGGVVLRLRNAVFAHLLLGSGLRVSEAVGLVIEDLVLDGGRRCVRVRCGKGGKARDVTIGSELRVLLKRYLAARRDRGEQVGPEAPVFPAGAGTRCMSRISGWRAWKTYLLHLGLDADGRGCHVARHSRATLLYAATRDLRLVGRELGHSDYRTTLVYADSLDEDRIAAADAIDEKLRTLTSHTNTKKTKTTKMKPIPTKTKQNTGPEATK